MHALCVDWMLMSAPCASAGVGKSPWNAKCALCASSTINARRARAPQRASAATSLQTP